jgi:thymidine phosphorylase
MILGAGRRTTDDVIDPAAGLVVDAYVGELVEPGAPPQVILCHDLAPGDGRLAEARAMVERAFVLDPPDAPPAPPPGSRILEILR